MECSAADSKTRVAGDWMFAAAVTVIVTCAVLLPAALDAVNVYVVVCRGETRIPA